MTAPEDPIARAARHFQAGDLDRAAKACKRVLKSRPKDVNALHLLGVVTYKAGNAKKAVGYLEGAIAGAGPDGELYRNLGFALCDSDRPREAAAAFERAVGLDASDIVARFQLAVLLGEADEEDEAADHFAQVLRRDPRNALAQYNHANALRKAGRSAESLDSFARAAELAPDDAKVYTGWGLALRRLGRWEEALEKYRRALDLGAESPDDILVDMGNALRESGHVAEAESHFDRILESSPRHAEALVGRASLLDRNRQFADAIDLVEPLVRQDEPPTGALLLYANLSGRIGKREEAISMMRRALIRDDLSREQIQNISFNLGKRCDEAGLYDEAFAHYTRANATKRLRIDPQARTRLTDELIRVFSREGLAKSPKANVASEKPVFIVGMPRSGTTLVEQILASHGQAAGAGELRDILGMVRDLPLLLGTGQDFANISSALKQDHVDAMARLYLTTLDGVSASAKRVTDKMPHNFEHLWLIRSLFPGAPIIHCLRDPLDVCLSCYFQSFGERHLYTRDLSALGHHYVDYRRLMAHWKAVIGGPFLEVSYERVVAEPEAESRELVDFVGLDWDPACLSFHENRRFVATASYDQVRRPIYATSAGRHANYAKHLGDLKEVLEAAGIK